MTAEASPLRRAAREHVAAALLTEAELKAFTTLQAQAALRGIRCDAMELDNGRVGYVVSRWTFTTTSTTLAELEALLRRMGVQ
ncbi:hypothetical protein [Aquincola sp. J276]|uniref:hypothetical protein n=1 Tax=Aquincola sp. J276 TaxID=2898432 RepID=UPI0021514F39|nr:hypothetical protein [Aquincola sp. J276]MCR5865226.1 hypothetical protein [Aquincola sp. J276]